jgi:hypothetical protein
MPTSWRSRLRLGNAIICGDARGVIPRLPDGYFRCLLTDPPYGICYVSGWNGGRNAKPIEGDDGDAQEL